MAEQKRERKKIVVVGRVLRWLSIGFLSLLLALMLIFQAPWKSTVLLAVFLAGCTLLPKRHRKWFWLSVGAAVLALAVWVFMPEDNKGWRPYTFDAESAAIEAKYAVPDEENAALNYDEIFKTLDVDSNTPHFYMASTPSSTNEPWLSKDHPEMAEWLKDRQDTMAKLLEASRRNRCYFSIPSYSWDMDQHTDRLALMRKCAFLLVSAGNNDIGEGRIDAGIEKYLCMIRMANHLHQQPAALDFLTGSALEYLALTRLNRFAIEDQPTAEQLQLISACIPDVKDNWGSEFQKWLELDRLFTKNNYFSMVYEINPQGKIRFSRDPFAALRDTLNKALPAPTYARRLLYKAKAAVAWLGLPPTPQEAAEPFDAAFLDRYNTMTAPDFDWVKERQKLGSFSLRSELMHIRFNLTYLARAMAVMSEHTYLGLHDSYLKSLAMRRGSRVLIALKQSNINNGRWPENLDAIKANAAPEALIDPQNNGPYVYRLTQDGFRLYSRGPNGKNEEGRRESDGPDDLSIWPPRQQDKTP